jgi:hypothetical protein
MESVGPVPSNALELVYLPSVGHKPCSASSDVSVEKLRRFCQRTASVLELCIPQWPCVNHMWPNFKCHIDVGGSGRGGEQRGIRKQRLC